MPMPLDAYAVNSNTGCLYFFYYRNGPGSFLWLLYVVIIIIELSIWRSFLSDPESFGYKIISKFVKENGFTHGAVFIQYLVYNIPGKHFAIVTTGNCSNVMIKKGFK